jgi:hypothetical protein
MATLCKVNMGYLRVCNVWKACSKSQDKIGDKTIHSKPWAMFTVYVY